MNYLRSVTKQIVKGTAYPPEIYLTGKPVLAVRVQLRPKPQVIVVTTEAVELYDLWTASLIRSVSGNVKVFDYSENTCHGALLAISNGEIIEIYDPWGFIKLQTLKMPCERLSLAHHNLVVQSGASVRLFDYITPTKVVDLPTRTETQITCLVSDKLIAVAYSQVGPLGLLK